MPRKAKKRSAPITSLKDKTAEAQARLAKEGNRQRIPFARPTSFFKGGDAPTRSRGPESRGDVFGRFPKRDKF